MIGKIQDHDNYVASAVTAELNHSTMNSKQFLVTALCGASLATQGLAQTSRFERCPVTFTIRGAFKTHARHPGVAARGVDALVTEIHGYAGHYCAMALGKEPDKELAVFGLTYEQPEPGDLVGTP
jgi:hypothetical protein